LHDDVAGGFPLYFGDPKVYMQYCDCDLMNTAAEEKNAIGILDYLYCKSAVYSETEENQKGTASHLTSVTVDGITAYGRGSSKKEAKLRAACAAVDQLRCRGLLQQRIIEKEVSANRVTQENAVTKLKRLYGALIIISSIQGQRLILRPV